MRTTSHTTGTPLATTLTPDQVGQGRQAPYREPVGLLSLNPFNPLISIPGISPRAAFGVGGSRADI